jgi:hypothetical protein
MTQKVHSYESVSSLAASKTGSFFWTFFQKCTKSIYSIGSTDCWCSIHTNIKANMSYVSLFVTLHTDYNFHCLWIRESEGVILSCQLIILADILLRSFNRLVECFHRQHLRSTKRG